MTGDIRQKMFLDGKFAAAQEDRGAVLIQYFFFLINKQMLKMIGGRGCANGGYRLHRIHAPGHGQNRRAAETVADEQ